MKNLFTYLKALWGAWGNLQSTDVSLDRRLTVGSPSGLDAKWKQNPFMRFAVVLTLIFTIGSGNVWGAEQTAYTLSGTTTGGTSGYADVSNITQSFKDWKVLGNTGISPWRIGGGKNTSGTNTNRYIYSQTAITENVTKVVVTHGAKSNMTVNSVTLNVYSTAAKAVTGGTGDISSVPVTYVDDDNMTFNRPTGHNWAGRFFRIDYDLTWTSTNKAKYILFSSAVFKYDDAPACSAPAAPTISGTAAYTAGQTITLTASCASEADASTTYTWYKGADWATARAASPVQAAATGSSGYTFTKASCVVGDAGKYWCEASNGSGCEAHNSTGYDVTISAGSVAVTGVSVAPTSKTIFVGETFDITPTVAPANATNKNVSWSSSATSYATVISGTVTGVAAGSSTITCKTNDGNFTATCAVTVRAVTLQARDEDGNAIGVGGPGAPTRSGATITAAANAGNYVFKQWDVVNATAASSTTSPTTISNPTGAVTVTAVYYKPITITYKANGATFTTQTYARGGTLAFPVGDPDGDDYSCTGKTFVGWVGEANKDYSDASTPPTYATAGGSVTAAATYYAVFATASGGGSTTKTDEFTYTSFFEACTPTGANVNGAYTDFSSISGSESDAVYAGNLMEHGDGPANCQDYIQMRSKNSHSGIITTTSGGTAKKVTVEWNSAQAADKVLNIYGKSTAYSAASDLYDDATDGDLLGTITSGTSTEYSITGDYEHIGIRSADGGLLFDEISIDWQVGGGVTYSNYATNCCEAPGTALSITSANSVATGGTVSLTSTGGNGGTVTWSVVNGTGSATVAGTTLTAGSVGTVTVKAHQDANTVLGTEYCAQDAEQAFTVVSSTINVTGVEVSPTTKAIVPGETFDITPTISPSNATDKSVSWTSSASDKASVSSGTVTGVAAGTATITCTTTDGSHTATTAVTVYAVTMQAEDEDGNAIAVGGPGTPSRTGASISPADDAGNYVFKEWAISGASLGSSASTKANTITNPTGAVTVTAKYYKPRTVKWSVNGNDSYTAGGATTAVAYNGTISTVPTDPSGLACAGTFVAWTDAAHNNGQTAKASASYYESALYTAAGDFPNITAETTTFYAVFAEKTNSDGYKYIGDDGTLADGKKYIFVSSKSAGSTKALKATDLPSVGNGTLGTAVDVTVTSNAEGVLVTTVNTDLEFEYVSSGTKLKYVVSGPTTRYLFVNGSGVGYKADDSRSRYTTAGLQGWNNAVSTYYDVYYNGSTGYTKAEGAASRVYAFIKQTATYGNYVTECDPNIVSVTYDANGGATSCANTTTDKTEDFTVCSSAPTRDYYTFAGWLCSADSKTYAASATIDDAVIDADFTLTAQWTPVTYTITYNYNGGSAQVDPVPATSYTVESSDITLQTPTKGHDRFDGWYENADLSTGGVKTTIPAGSHENKTYYAKWTARHEIIFDADGVTTTIYRADDENMEDAVAGQGSVPSDPSAPSACSSKVFMGWSESTIDDETDDAPGDLMKPAAGTVDEDKHYYAVWATESSESGTVNIINDDFNVTGTDEVTSRSGWSDLGTVYGGSGSIRFSSGKNAGTMKLVKTGKGFGTAVTSATITFKIKKYGSDSYGKLYISSAYGDLTTTFSTDGGKTTSTSAYYSTTDGSNWTSCTCTVGSIHSGTDIVLEGETNSRVYVKDFVMSYTGTVYTYTAYSTSCCATKITLSAPSITDAASSGATITFNKGTTVGTCGGSKEVEATLTLPAGYQATNLSFSVNSGTVSISPAISTPVNTTTTYTLTFAEDQNATLTTTATIAAKPLSSITLAETEVTIYDQQYVQIGVTYDPADILTKGYTLVSSPTKVVTTGSTQTQFKISATKAGVVISSETKETVSIKANADNTKTASVEVTILPLPKVHFADNVHNESFSDVVATIEDNALSATKQTPTHADYTGSTANSCEEQHLHLVGWIDGDWAPYAAYMNGTGSKPTESAITGATGYFYLPGADIDVSAKDGKTYYAVWAKVE